MHVSMLLHILFVVLVWSNTKGESSEESRSACDEFELVTREEWGARPPREISYITHSVNMTFVHHTAGRQCFDKATCMSYVRGVQDWHMDGNGWNDIGYSFLIGEDGRVYEGRGWGVVGSHTLNYNTVAYGFSIMGDFMTLAPEDIALQATSSIIQCGVEKGYILFNYELFGHKDGRCTSCPGDYLYTIIRGWPRYSFRPIPIYCNSDSSDAASDRTTEL